MVSPQKFEFFSKLDHEKVYKALKRTNADSSDRDCTDECPYIAFSKFSMRDYDDICKKLIKLISHLCTKEGTLAFAPSLKPNEYEYLNYRLNVELKEINKNFSEIKEELIKNMKNDAKSCFKKDDFKEKLHDIEKSDIDYMKNIDDLYRNYSNMGYLLKSGKSSNMSCLDYARECHKIYELSIKECPNKGNELYKALETFKTTYESFFGDQTIGSSCHFPDLNKLRSYEEIIATPSRVLTPKEDERNITTTILVLTIVFVFLLIFLYMFTPVGKWLNPKNRKRNKIINNIIEKKHQELKHTSVSEINDNDNLRYNISYRS
ncbi:PIR protein [Plasmodium vivax]|uniref:VIR protein n=1 Tax=Plasmodium vivax TaxID=5855 RepID=A0A565A3N0_PLAVI|nr:PIR protein [Plasmodium vivax]